MRPCFPQESAEMRQNNGETAFVEEDAGIERGQGRGSDQRPNHASKGEGLQRPYPGKTDDPPASWCYW